MRMRPSIALGVLSLWAFLSTSAQAEPPQVPPTFPSEVEMITIDAVVVDGDGRPVPGLTREDFVIEEDGKVQEIATFEASVADVQPVPAAPAAPGAPAAVPSAPRPQSTGRLFALVVDDVSMTPGDVKVVAQTLSKLVENELRDGDEATLWTTSGQAWWSARIPDGHADLVVLLGRLKGRGILPAVMPDYMSDYEAFWIANHEHDRNGSTIQRVAQRWLRTNVCASGGGGPLAASCESMVQARAVAANADRERRTRLTFDTLRRAILAFAPIRGRKSLLLFSPGFVGDPQLGSRDVALVAREANTAVYFLDARGLVVQPGLPSAADAGPAPDPNTVGAMSFETSTLESTGAQDLAQDTGGFSIRNTNDLTAAASRVAAEARAFYLLGFYAPEGKKAGVWRKLQVSVKRKGLEVRARRGYALRDATTAAKSAEKVTAPAVARALDGVWNIGQIPVRAIVYVLEPKSKDKTRVLVAAELDAARVTFEPSGQQRVARLELKVLATHRDSGRAIGADERFEVRLGEGEAPGWRSVVHELELPEGVSQVRVVVHDPQSDRLGAVSQRVEVPPANALRLSTPVLTNVIGPSADGKPPEPALSAHRVFPPQGLLYCRFEVFGAARESDTSGPRVATGLELRAADGRVVRQAAPTRVATGADGRVVRLLGIAVEELGEGVYDLVLQVHDEVSGARVERHEAFTLAREAAGGQTHHSQARRHDERMTNVLG